MSSISGACHRRSESALLANSTVVELDAEVFGDVLDVNDEFGSFLTLFNTARNVPVEVEVHVQRGGRNHADLAERCFFFERLGMIFNGLEDALAERVNGPTVGVDAGFGREFPSKHPAVRRGHRRGRLGVQAG